MPVFNRLKYVGDMTKLHPRKDLRFVLRYRAKKVLTSHLIRMAIPIVHSSMELILEQKDRLMGKNTRHRDNRETRRILGDIGAPLYCLVRYLKVPEKALGIKLCLNQSIINALFEFQKHAVDLLREIDLFFNTPIPQKPEERKKYLRGLYKGGFNIYATVDKEAEEKACLERTESVKAILKKMIDLYWSLSFELTGDPPGVFLIEKHERLKQENPHLNFHSIGKLTYTQKKKAKESLLEDLENLLDKSSQEEYSEGE